MRVRLHKNNSQAIPKWKKHAASSTNPTRTKFRDAARMQLLATSSSISQQSPSIENHIIEPDRLSECSQTTVGTSATSAKVQVNARVIQALLDRCPSENDQSQMVTWLNGVERAYRSFHRSDSTSCLEYIPRLFDVCINHCLLSVHKRVQASATNVLKIVIKTILKPQEETLRTNPLFEQLFKVVEHGLTYAYTLSWNFVLHLLADMFDLLGKDHFELCRDCLSSLAGLRATQDFSFMAELDATVGKAIRVFGPKRVLQVIPLNLTGTISDVQLERSWLLPLLRDHITHTELNHFVSYFLPIAFQLQTTAENLKDKGDNINSTVLFTLQDQLWSLFPGYCSYPTDISVSLKLIAKGVGTSLTRRPDLRLHLLVGLRNLVSKTDNETDRIEVAKYAKNYLPLLFNIYTSEKWNVSRDLVRQSLFETIKRYLTLTEASLCNSFFDKCLEKTQNEDMDNQTLVLLLDIVLALVPYLDDKRLQSLEEKLRQLFSMEGGVKRRVMKKSYRILEELCSRSTPAIQQFVDERRSTLLLEHLLSTLTKSQSALKGAQLRCITNLLKMSSNQSAANIKLIIPQAVQCLHEINGRTRHEAYLLVVQCARLWITLSEHTFIDALTAFFHFLMAGLVNPHSPSMSSATLLGISRLCLEFKENLAGPIVDELVSTLVLVLQSKERQIVQAALSFCRVLFIVVNETVLTKYIDQLARSLTIMRDEHNFTFRSKIKLILQKLLKIFDFEALRDLFPVTFHPQLTYIHKMQVRRERRRKGTSTVGQSVITKPIDDDDDEEYVDDNETTFTVRPKLTIDQLLNDSDEEELNDMDDARTIATARTTASTRRRRQQQSSLWIKETHGDDPLDLTEPTAARSIYATKPLTTRETEAIKEAAKAKRRNSRFRTAPDGRLVIDMDDEDGGHKEAEDYDDDDDEETKREDLKDLMETLSLSQRFKNKRKRPTDDDVSEDFEVEDRQSQSIRSKYRPGGGGIHPTLNQQPSKSKNPRSGEIYKAKRGTGGDRKVANKHDPYAYIKLDFNALNKRKRTQFKGQFEQLVGAAKRGAKRGAKLGAKERHLKKNVKRLAGKR